MRFGHVVMAYFVIGTLMWGAGLITWDDSGVGSIIIDDPYGNSEDQVTNEETGGALEQAGGAIREAAAAVGGAGLLAVWDFLAGLTGFLFWPVTVLISVNAPAEFIGLFGGVPTLGFYLGLLRMIRGSA